MFTHSFNISICSSCPFLLMHLSLILPWPGLPAQPYITFRPSSPTIPPGLETMSRSGGWWFKTFILHEASAADQELGELPQQGHRDIPPLQPEEVN